MELLGTVIVCGLLAIFFALWASLGNRRLPEELGEEPILETRGRVTYGTRFGLRLGSNIGWSRITAYPAFLALAGPPSAIIQYQDIWKVEQGGALSSGIRLEIGVGLSARIIRISCSDNATLLELLKTKCTEFERV